MGDPVRSETGRPRPPPFGKLFPKSWRCVQVWGLCSPAKGSILSLLRPAPAPLVRAAILLAP
jgi:hypothetical protein